MTPAPEVLVDTSVWIEHFRRGSAPLAELLAGDAVRMHPLVLLELACGSPPAPRARTLADLARLRPAPQAGQAELLAFIEQEQLFDSGCGAVDIHLLASARLLPGARLWTLDKPLHALARRLGVAWVVPTR
ncbi:MAG TPA: VapC toxin family PIN domain ribonuclease [Ottowia sp.]|nr:VapC toxin family PIN domain ribonuclease [Ottowia sp.]HNI85307.1 VapC toxin family PIN domain ribonuclease [Ottowia sp.]HNJ46152.1 VapC toxin family PIN domain ribonuclease [Ottowia sp.]HNK54011.1 VapC toxin family PIN domain ribonuclease [Ottowia sp.]HNN34050.1 VapC toxin family PIN domain ribonuclease [Ottowia sp.]